MQLTTTATAATTAAAAMLFLAAIVQPAPGQVAKGANEGYQTEQQRAGVARNLANPEREKRDKPRELLAEIGIEPGTVVADIGTGVGFMIPFFLERGGPQGKLYAEDIQQDFLDKVEAKKKENGWANVETVLGDERDAKLPAAAVDLAFILDAYHHFNYPEEALAKIRASIAPGGRLVVIDFYRSRPHPRMPAERLENHIRKDRDGFAEEIEAAGFKLVRHFDQLPHQYVLIFKRTS